MDASKPCQKKTMIVGSLLEMSKNVSESHFAAMETLRRSNHNELYSRKSALKSREFLRRIRKTPGNYRNLS